MAGPQRTRVAGRRRSRGASSIEYALLLTAIAAIIAAAAFELRQPVEGAFRNLVDQWTMQASDAGNGTGTGPGGGGGSPTPTPTPTPTATPSPSATPSLSPSPTPSPTP